MPTNRAEEPTTGCRLSYSQGGEVLRVEVLPKVIELGTMVVYVDPNESQTIRGQVEQINLIRERVYLVIRDQEGKRRYGIPLHWVE